MIKFVCLLRRKPGITLEQFLTHYRDVHGPLFASFGPARKHVRKYVQNYASADVAPGFPPSDIDGMSEIWLDDVEALKEVFHCPEYMSIVRPDEEHFIDFSSSTVSIVEERNFI